MIDWQTPFVYAFELLMFTIGWTLVFLIVAVGLLIMFAIVRGLILGFAKFFKRERPKSTEELERDLVGKLRAVK